MLCFGVIIWDFAWFSCPQPSSAHCSEVRHVYLSFNDVIELRLLIVWSILCSVMIPEVLCLLEPWVMGRGQGDLVVLASIWSWSLHERGPCSNQACFGFDSADDEQLHRSLRTINWFTSPANYIVWPSIVILLDLNRGGEGNHNLSRRQLPQQIFVDGVDRILELFVI